MSRLSSSTYSSICLLVFLHFVWLLLAMATAKPASSSLPSLAPPSTATPTKSNGGSKHVASFVSGNRGPAVPHMEFDSERNEVEAVKSAQVHQLFSGLLQLQGPSNNSLDTDEAVANTTQMLETDDAPISERITLDDELTLTDAVSEQHEGSTEQPGAWPRVKLAIPVLEPLKHLLNTVGGGGVNDTHVETNRHRLIGHDGVHHSPHPHSNNTSPAIETEEDREEAFDSTGFNLLETLGTAGNVLLGMLQNLRKLFVASAGNASTAFSGGGGGGGAANAN